MKTGYAGMTPSKKVFERMLEEKNRRIFDNSLIGVPTGLLDDQGRKEYEIQAISDYLHPAQKYNPAQNVDIKSLLGDNVTVTRYPILSLKFDRGVDPLNQKIVSSGSAYSMIAGDLGYENKLRIGTGTTIGSSYFINNVKYMNYQAGYEFRFAGTPVWSHETYPLDVELLAGLFDGDNGYSIGFADGEAEWGFMHMRSGQRNFIPKSEFNVDKLDGSGLTGFTLDYTKGNIYRIRSLYFGYGPTILEVFDGLRWITAHILQYPNTSSNTNVTETYLPIAVSVNNGNNAEDYYIEIASTSVSILIDSSVRDVNDRGFSDSFSGTYASGSNQPVIGFKSKTQIQLAGMPSPKENRILSDLRSAYIDIRDQNKTGTVLLVIVPEADVTGGTFLDKDTDRSVLSIATDITGVSLTNAVTVFERSVAKISDKVDIQAERNALSGLRGGYVAVLLYTTTATTTDISLTFTWDEQH